MRGRLSGLSSFSWTVPIFSAVDDHREHVKKMQSIRLRASHLMKIDVIHQLVCR